MNKTMPEVPNKLFYKIGEVCEITDTQPYVLRFWESEFPQLAPRKNRSGQRVYQRKDIDTVIRIKKLLYEEEYTIAGARKRLDEEGTTGTLLEAPARAAHPQPSTRPKESREKEREKDHPVDVIVARAEAEPAAVRKSAQAARGAEQRLARLEKSMTELKGLLKETLGLLRRP